jgi:PKD repeat protein
MLYILRGTRSAMVQPGIRVYARLPFLAVVYVSVLLAGCGHGGVDQSGLASSAQLPPLAQIRKASAGQAEQRIHTGSDYLASVIPSHVAIVGSDALSFTPPDSLTGSLADASYAVYSFTLPAPAAADAIHTNWLGEPPLAHDAWLGLSDWGSGRWDWQRLQDTNQPLSDGTKYCDANGQLLVAVVICGAGEYTLQWIRVGGNTPPEVAVALLNTEGRAPREVTFDATQTRDIDGSVANYEWDWWGDGSFDLTGEAESSPAHSYILGGHYTAELRVTDNLGASTETELSFELQEHSPWWRISGDRRNARHAEVAGPQQEPADFNWFYPTQYQVNAVVLGVDGTLYLNEEDMRIHAVNPNGSQRWMREFGNNAYVGFCQIGPDGAVYTKYWDESSIPRILALNPDNTVKWDLPFPGTNPTGCLGFTLDGLVLFGDNGLHVIQAFQIEDGSVAWDVPEDAGTQFSQVAVAKNGTLYCYFRKDTNSRMIAVSPAGAELWNIPVYGSGQYGPLLSDTGYVFISGGFYTNRVYIGYSPAGERTIECIEPGLGTMTPTAIGYDQELEVLYGSDGPGENLLCGSTTGLLSWSYADPARTYGPDMPLVGGDQKIYISHGNSWIYCLKPNKNVKWQWDAQGESPSGGAYPVAIAADGTLYLIRTQWDGVMAIHEP